MSVPRKYKLYIYLYMFFQAPCTPCWWSPKSLLLRTVLIAILAVALGNTYMVENPGSSVMPYYHRWQTLSQVCPELCTHLDSHVCSISDINQDVVVYICIKNQLNDFCWPFPCRDYIVEWVCSILMYIPQNSLSPVDSNYTSFWSLIVTYQNVEHLMRAALL